MRAVGVVLRVEMELCIPPALCHAHRVGGTAMQLRFSRSLLVTLAVVLVACGEDDPKPDDTGEPTDTGDTAPPDVPPEPLAGEYIVDQADAIIQDPEGVTQLGIGMGTAGDMNGDGQEDLLVVSPSCSEEPQGVLTGAYLFYGG
jgi:hypothetical protein